jgi:hypothetical protein
MTDWTKEQLDILDGAGEIEIAPRRDDGTPRRARPIWVVRVGDDLYVRSYRGPDGSWFRTVSRSRRATIRAGGVQHDVQLTAAADVDRAAVDAAYSDKYGRSSYVDAMVTAAAAATTLRLTPEHREDR